MVPRNATKEWLTGAKAVGIIKTEKTSAKTNLEKSRLTKGQESGRKKQCTNNF